MPRIDTALIEGYADMTPEEKLAALEALEFEPAKDTGDADKLKAALTKANSEAAEYKRKLREKQTAEEQAEAERAAREAATQAELEQLRKEKAITESKANYLALGYEDKLAAETAQALADGDMAKVFANQKAHIENIRKIERAAALAGAGANEPPAGGTQPTYTKDSVKTLSITELNELYQTQPEVFAEITSTQKE